MLGGTSAVSGNTINNLTFSSVTGDVVHYAFERRAQWQSTTRRHGASFNGTLAGATLTTANAYTISDMITDAADDSSLGFVRLKNMQVYVTPKEPQHCPRCDGRHQRRHDSHSGRDRTTATSARSTPRARRSRSIPAPAPER